MTTEQEKFLNKIVKAVTKYAPKYDIKVYSPIIAQAILESAWGKSKLAEHNNFFGLKAGNSFKGDTITLDTKEETKGGMVTVSAAFRKYKTLDAGVAVWTAYGDSIPIESLTESINETSQVGKVTGSLADALNWAGISEDKFNEKLKKCKTTQERAKLITDTLNGAYEESKTAFNKVTEGAQNSRQAQYDLMVQESDTAEAIEPLTAKLDALKTKLLNEINPAIEETSGKLSDVVDKTSDWIDELNEFSNTGLGKMTYDALMGIAKAFQELIIPIDKNREAQEKWAEEFGAIDAVVTDVKNSLYWLGDVYDGMKNKGMTVIELLGSIVVLAVIAIITIPIIVEIYNGATVKDIIPSNEYLNNSVTCSTFLLFLKSLPPP